MLKHNGVHHAFLQFCLTRDELGYEYEMKVKEAWLENEGPLKN